MKGIVILLSLLVFLAGACSHPSIINPAWQAGAPGTDKSWSAIKNAVVMPAARAAEPPVAPHHESSILVVYPKEDAHIDSASTFLVGSCPAGARLTCNGSEVRLNAQGYFAHVVRLKPGTNTFTLALQNVPEQKRMVRVFRDSDPPPLPPRPLKIAADSVEPKEDLGVTAGDVVALCVRATPGGRVDAYVGRRKIALVPAWRAPRAVNRGLDAAYGSSYQRRGRFPADLYCGFYTVSPADHWHNVRPRFVLAKAGRTLSLTARASLTTIEQPSPAQTKHDDTVVRLGPGQARTTPLAAGVRLLVDGWQGSSMRCLLAPGRHVWILKEDLLLENIRSVAPSSAVRTINISDEPGGLRISVPLSQRLPYQIEQQLVPNRLILRIFGATADTDWITPARPVTDSGTLDHVTWRQPEDRVYEMTAHLKSDRQWGFWASYEENDLVLHIKDAPHLMPESAPLAGLRICVDPGHGGEETGALGPSGTRESTVNLAIALKLKELLQREGAHVVMTRQTETEGPSLAARVETAVREKCDLLLSVHNNALPDGRDPWAEHGTSSYWYHPQAIELARTLKKALVQEVGFPDYGTYYQNLALARPSQMPAVLVEVGFMINPDEYAQLLDPQVQDRAASALLKGIKKYVGASK
ncbi:MAG TPA: N-acetylmuramoyl-L-alanine amidase [Candidatus Obscuribacterales bacterium]